MKNYTDFAYTRFTKKRNYVWGRYTKFYRKKISFKNKKVLDFGCGNILTSSTAKFFRDENGNLKGLYGYETDFKSKKILIDNKLYFNFYSKKQKMFDIIVANQVYEHLDSLERIKFIKQSKKLLKKNGLLVVAFPFVLSNMNFKYFWEDITHKPVGVEAEAGLIQSFGFNTDLYVGGLKGDPFGWFENILAIIRNLIVFMPPFWITLIIAKKR